MFAGWLPGLLLVLVIASNVIMAWQLCLLAERLSAMGAGLSHLREHQVAKKSKKKSLPALGRLP
jgi:hypothetical protein